MRPEPVVLSRPRLERGLDAATARRLTCVVAGAGYGKTTLLSAWAGGVAATSYTLTGEDRTLSRLAGGLVDLLWARVPGLPADLATTIKGACGPDSDDGSRAAVIAAMVCDALRRSSDGRMVLVLDDVDVLAPDTASARLIEGFCRHAPPGVNLVLSGRREPPFRIDRLRAYGDVAEITAAELAFTEEETRTLVVGVAGPDSAGFTTELHEATGGWPVAVRLGAEALRDAPAAQRKRIMAGVRRADGPLFDHLASEVFAREPFAVRELVRVAAAFGRVTAPLCEALGQAGAADTLCSLVKRGLFIETRPARGDGGPGFGVIPLAREFALRVAPVDPWELREIHERAAGWFVSQGDIGPALESLTAIADHDGIAGLLAEHGRAMLAAGAVDTVLAAVESLPDSGCDPAIWRLAGEARQVKGDWDRALSCFARADGGADSLDAGLAWRIGLIHYLRGDPDRALATYRRCVPGDGDPGEEALLLAWMATAHWTRGEVEECRELVRRALDLATAASDARALASAHTAAAMLAALEGDRAANDAHNQRALAHAEQAGDVLQVIRVRTNRASHHMEEGDYRSALAELGEAIPLADLTGFAAFQALGLHNRGDTYRCLGRLAEAVADLEAAKRLCQRMGSAKVCHPLRALGDVYRLRGDRALARASYAEAIRSAEQGPELQTLVASLAGLARVLAPDEPEEATRLAERAVSYGPGQSRPAALLAAGWVALWRGERARAYRLATDAGADAGRRRDRASVADSMLLAGLTCDRSGRVRELLDQAAAIWREIGDPLGPIRVDVATARLLAEDESGTAAARAFAERAEQAARVLGAYSLAGHAAEVVAALEPTRTPPAVTVRTLGDFQVVRDGRPVPTTAWQSRKARDLLKILLARRGRPVSRMSLMEALWPGEDPRRLGNRLSVALSTVRGVLDPDKTQGVELVVAEGESVRLDVTQLAVDVEDFLADAATGLALWREGFGTAKWRLARAEAAYAGDFLEDSPYEDWAVPLREEARATYVRVARALAELADAVGDHDGAARFRLRILGYDPYDEKAHLALVRSLERAGGHGEARRRYHDYAARMAEIDVEAAPFPAGL